MTDRAELLQGTLDLLILKALAPAPLHGWGVSKRLRQLSADALSVGQGSLYPALYRLEDRGWVTSEKGATAEGREVRLYRLTAAGRRHFASEQSRWHHFSAVVNQVLAAP
jgi:transcriptional regulator